ncbi:unnamed protein product [Prunus brigantina]
MVEVETSEELEFKWGKKKGRGGRNKDVQFYESFTYDGVEYGLYDCVYLYKESEPEPEIGKLIKIWETGEKAKKVKVLWFFRPCEILNFLGAEEILENELFLASGEGVGLANLNPLEAIAGKCNVLCISKDKENPLPSAEELQIAEFVFRRTFDVGQQKIMDKIDGQIAGIDVKFMFNRMDIQKPGGVLKVDLGKNEVCGNSIESNETMVLSKKNSFKEHVTLETNGNCVDSSTQENADLVKHKPSLVEKPAFGVGLKSSDMDKTNEKGEHASNPKALLRSKVKSNEGEVRRGKVHARQVAEEEIVKCTKDSVDLDNRPTKKAKIDCTIKVSDDKGKICEQRHVKVEEKIRCTKGSSELDHGQSKSKLNTSTKVVNDKSKTSDHKRMNDKKVLSSTASTLDDKCKLKSMENSLGTNKAPCKKTKPDDKATTLSNVKLPKTSQRKDFLGTNEGPSKKMKPDVKVMTLSDGNLPPPTESQNKAKNYGSQVLEVTQRPDADRRTWFKGFPWEDRMQTAHEQGTLVLLQNLDPAYTSAEVEDIVWHGFKESCTAKMIQRISNSSPHSGQALVIFKTREAAQRVVRKLEEGCLLLSNGRPLVGSIGTRTAEKKPIFFGHLVIDKLRQQMMREREMKEAVSTSHCSQPNTTEYDMAMEWCLLQERSDLVWGNLYKQQGKELRKLKAELKAK